jgi:putative transposase
VNLTPFFRHGRTGTLWEGRHKSCPVDTEGYVLAYYRYIELNPVRARMVESPEHFRWSSYASNALDHADALLTPHVCYIGLAKTPALRVKAYSTIVRESLTEAAIEEIRQYLQQQRALGADTFRTMVEAKTKRFAGIRPAHRPRKQSAATCL